MASTTDGHLVILRDWRQTADFDEELPARRCAVGLHVIAGDFDRARGVGTGGQRSAGVVYIASDRTIAVESPTLNVERRSCRKASCNQMRGAGSLNER